MSQLYNNEKDRSEIITDTQLSQLSNQVDKNKKDFDLFSQTVEVHFSYHRKLISNLENLVESYEKKLKIHDNMLFLIMLLIILELVLIITVKG